MFSTLISESALLLETNILSILNINIFKTLQKNIFSVFAEKNTYISIEGIVAAPVAEYSRLRGRVVSVLCS